MAGSLTWGVLVDGFRPDRYDLVGAALCLAGAVIMYAPRANEDQPHQRRPEGAR